MRSRTLGLYAERRLVLIMLISVSSGLPLALVLSTLSTWLARLGVDKTTIGLFSLVSAPYTFKFLWAPVFDRVRVPWLTARLGRRRSWLIVTQIALGLAIALLGVSDPGVHPGRTAAAAVLVAFISASLDIVLDAFRVESLDEPRQGAGGAMTQFGYRIGLIIATAGALHLTAVTGWPQVYFVMACCVAIGLAATVAAAEPDARPVPARGLADIVLVPLADIVRRPGIAPVLVFIALYKLSDVLATALASKFYVDLGFTNAEIADVTKVVGLIALMVGGFLGGIVVARLGTLRALFLCGIVQMVAILPLVALALRGHDVPLLALAVIAEYGTNGMGGAAFVALLSSLCRPGLTATQYALFSSLFAVTRMGFQSTSGPIADALGWSGYFVLATFGGLPALVILAGFWPRFRAALARA